MEHHDRTVAAGIARYSVWPHAIGIILIGSLVRGEERPDSDVDLYLIMDDEYTFTQQAFCDFSAGEIYEHGFLDVKVMTIRQMRAASRCANDPMRASFDRARIVWAASTDLEHELASMVIAIAKPSEENWVSHQAAFVAQAAIHGGYFVSQGEELGNHIMMHYGAVHFVFAVGRAILALNRVLFAGPKYLEKLLDRCPVTLPRLVPRLRAFLEVPTAQEAAALLGELWELADWPIDEDQLVGRFVEDNEFAGLTGVVPPEYR